MQPPPIEPPLKRVCYISSGDSSDEPLSSDLDSPPQIQTAGQKNQADLVTGGDVSVTDDDSGSEDSDDDKMYDSGTDSDLDRDIFASDYGKVTPEVWAKFPAEELAQINNLFMSFLKLAAAHACVSQKVEDLQLILANSRGSGSVVEFFFTFTVKGPSPGKVPIYEAKGIRVYNYENRSPEHFRTDTLEYVRLRDEHDQLTAPVRT